MKSISVSTVLDNIIDGDSRLDATYYASAVFQARQIIDNYESRGHKINTIGDFFERNIQSTTHKTDIY